MVRDYLDRLSRVIALKKERGQPVNLFIGGPDAKAALRGFLSGFAKVGSLPVFTRTNPPDHMITVTVGVFHPSYGFMCGDPNIQQSIREEFHLYKAVCTVAALARSRDHYDISEDVISTELEAEHLSRLQQNKESLRDLDNFLHNDPTSVDAVMEKKSSIGYHDGLL
jgi:hypothetical protein